ncbi:MAG TPA: SpoIIE family protein phosphatase [Thermoanaerobaculia bacterium]|nr:SpoIIE family protein phosphatase [Thermoanaerobaculia bacterium]
MLVLNVRVPGEPARRIRLDRPVLTLGRSSTNDVPLGDRTLSRVHARIEGVLDGGPIRLVDLGSRNGTSLNGSRITEPVPLSAGDRIQLGETLVEIIEESTTRVVIDPIGEESSKRTTFLQSSKDLLRPHKQAYDTKLGAEELARLNASLRMLNEISVDLLGDIPLNRLLELILEKTFTFLQPDRGLLMLADEHGELKPEKVKYAPGVDPSDIRLSKTLIQSVVEKKNGVLLIDAATDAGLGAAESIRIQGITSCMAAPLFVEDRVIGLIYLEVRLGRKSFSEEDLRLLTSLANTSAIKIQNLRLQEGAAARQRIEREMALAWDIQRRLLPEAEPILPHTELLGRTVPSRTVSGDYYDFFERGDKSLDVVVADVSGKGMGASILAASVQAAFQAWAGEHFPPDRLLSRLNEMVYRRTSPEKFITFFLALYDPESGSVVFSNAGHNPGILVRAGGKTELLGAHGPPLGLFPGKTYGSGTFTLEAGDVLALYTDGVTEAANPVDEEFGTPRLVETLVKARGGSVAQIEAELGATLTLFTAGTPFGDDRTFVLLKRT